MWQTKEEVVNKDPRERASERESECVRDSGRERTMGRDRVKEGA